MNIHEDQYFFHTEEYAKLKDTQNELEQQSSWEYGITSFAVQPLEDPMAAEVVYTTPGNTIPKDILLDTVENAGLMLDYAGKSVCLRDCAMPSLLTTAGISGGGVSRTKKPQLAIGLTAFLTGSREKSQVLTRANKVAAVVSSHYEWMPISQLLDICDDLENDFGPADFYGGAVSHSLTVAQFRYPCSAPAATDAYNKALVAAGKVGVQEVVPVVEFRASDTSGEAARLMTYLKIGALMMPIGEGVKVVHIPPLEYDANGTRLTCMEKFRKEAANLFAKISYDIDTIVPEMLSCPIEYPGNVLVKLCKYAQIPQKWGGILEEEIRADWPDNSGCTFLDVFETLSRSTSLAIQEGASPQSKRVLDLEEGLAKIANNKASWKKYDLPGSVSWS